MNRKKKYESTPYLKTETDLPSQYITSLPPRPTFYQLDCLAPAGRSMKAPGRPDKALLSRKTALFWMHFFSANFFLLKNIMKIKAFFAFL